jgi:hypothetical protein
VSLRKEVKELLREAERQGWRVERRSRHYMLFAPDGKGKVTIASTPSTPRAITHSVARMRRYGFVWKGR